MRVEVKLYAILRRYRPATAAGPPHRPFWLALPDGASVAALVAELGIPDGLVNAAAVNEETAELTRALQDGDLVRLFPPSAGGGGR